MFSKCLKSDRREKGCWSSRFWALSSSLGGLENRWRCGSKFGSRWKVQCTRYPPKDGWECDAKLGVKTQSIGKPLCTRLATLGKKWWFIVFVNRSVCVRHPFPLHDTERALFYCWLSHCPLFRFWWSHPTHTSSSSFPKRGGGRLVFRFLCNYENSNWNITGGREYMKEISTQPPPTARRKFNFPESALKEPRKLCQKSPRSEENQNK